MLDNDELLRREAKLSALRRDLDRLEAGINTLARAGGADANAELIDVVRREMAVLEAITRNLRDGRESAQGRGGLRGMTPAMAFALAC